MSAEPAITAIVVSRDLGAMLEHCLQHLGEALQEVNAAASHRIVVVDNASRVPFKPGEVLGRPIKLLRFDRHRSFAVANNRAVRQAPNDFYFLLNNDVFLHRQALRDMHMVLSRDDRAGICGSRLVFPDATLQHCGVVFGRGRKGPYHVERGTSRELVATATREWQAVTGACMLVRGELWNEIGGLDESYPFGLEDIDFCLRARQRGWRIFCSNRVDSLHFESQTPGRERLDRPSRQLFLKRWRGRYTVDG